MTDLNKRIAALRESRFSCYGSMDGGGPAEREVEPDGDCVLADEALTIIDEQQREIASKDAEIERLRAIEMRFSEREPAALRSRLRDAESEIKRLAAAIMKAGAEAADEFAAVDAGPTPLRGRITARNRTDEEGRN